MHPLLEKLTGGDRRSIGRSAEIVAEVLANPELFDVVFQGMAAPDPVVRMRCADVVEKATRNHPDWLAPYTTPLLTDLASSPQAEVRWHVAQLIPRLPLDPDQRAMAVALLSGFLTDDSRIVKTSAMQALADLALQDSDLRPAVINQLEVLTRTGSPAMRSRGRQLLARLRRPHIKENRL